MAPNTISVPTGVLHATDEDLLAREIKSTVDNKPDKRELKLVWRNIILFIYLHMAGLYGAYLMFTSAKLATSLWGVALYLCGGLGITAGAHRLWAHKSYKAKWQLRLLLTFFNTLAFQVSFISLKCANRPVL